MISLSKKFIGFFATLLFLLVTINSVYSADVYSTYKPLYTVDTPTDIYVSGYACNNTECTSVDLDSKVSLYNGDSIFACVDTYNLNGNYPQLLSCFDSAAIDSDYYSISGDDYIVVKYDSEKSFGYLTYFSASEDEYFVNYIRKDNIICDFDLCLDNQFLNWNNLYKPGVQTARFIVPLIFEVLSLTPESKREGRYVDTVLHLIRFAQRNPFSISPELISRFLNLNI